MKVQVAPANSIIFIFDTASKNIVVPTYLPGELIASNKTCISVDTLSEYDGETSIEISSDLARFEDRDLAWTQDLRISTPSKKVSIVTSQNDRLLSLECSDTTTKIAIGVNDENEPDRIVVIVS